MPVVWPKDNPYTPEKTELGRYLYFDPRLSADGTVSCGTCHNPQYAFTDGAPVSTGIRGQKGNRSAPTVINRAYSLAQFWDGRAPTLEAQAAGPMANPIEMGNTHQAIVDNLKKVQGYRELFARAFGTEDFTIEHIAKAIATLQPCVPAVRRRPSASPSSTPLPSSGTTSSASPTKRAAKTTWARKRSCCARARSLRAVRTTPPSLR